MFVCEAFGEVNCQTRFPESLLTFSDNTCLSPNESEAGSSKSGMNWRPM